MIGRWVYIVVIRRGGLWARIIGGWFGANSAFDDFQMAARKARRLRAALKVMSPLGRDIVAVQKIMFFEGIALEGDRSDCCSVCGGQMKNGEPLTRI